MSRHWCNKAKSLTLVYQGKTQTFVYKGKAQTFVYKGKAQTLVYQSKLRHWYTMANVTGVQNQKSDPSVQWDN